MSTFLVVSGVITTAVILVVGIALSDADQPATIRLGSRRARRRQQRAQAAATEAPPPSHAITPTEAPEWADQGEAGPSEWDDEGLSVWEDEGPGEWEDEGPSGPERVDQPSVEFGPRRRARSGLTLLLMVAFLGTLVAFAVGAAVALTAQALRHTAG